MTGLGRGTGGCGNPESGEVDRGGRNSGGLF